jgi:hypothetical protein
MIVSGGVSCLLLAAETEEAGCSFSVSVPRAWTSMSVLQNAASTSTRHFHCREHDSIATFRRHPLLPAAYHPPALRIMSGHVEEPKRFEPKKPVQLDPPKDDPISLEYLSKCDG